ncbi:MAG TPA: phosphatidylglycerol lysyltransferase domain-containing protein [Planctomycetota bacterium]|nr:phosphatidylglycerol lysyltransferase domain-containing protein [Planctomycetota bacterium]
MAEPISRVDAAWQRAGLSSRQCLACDVCCRFASPTACFVPFFTATEAGDCGLPEPQTASPEPGVRPVVKRDGEAWRCPCRRAGAQECTVYERRPLDCRLYPFVLMFDATGREVWLGLDEVCPFALDHQGTPALAAAADEAARLLDGPLADAAASAPGIVSRFHDHIRPLRVLPDLTRRICRPELGLARLVSTSHQTLKPFFMARPTCLTGHAFPAIYLWADLFNLHWRVEADCLLVFAESDGVSFLMAPPLGQGDVPKALRVAAEIMAAINGPRGGARAQEVDEGLLPAFAAEGWQVGHRAQEYICETASLIELRGRHHDGRRHDIRRFEKAHKAVWRPYQHTDFPQCVALLRRWQHERAASHPDPFYRDQLDATGFLHLRTLREAEELGLQGYVVEVETQGMDGCVDEWRNDRTALSDPHPSIQSSNHPVVIAYTFGFPLADGETFADFIEVADLSYPGLAAWTFRRFCREVRDWPFLNVGTDSELPNLACAKLAYRPARIVPSYILNAPQ